MLAALESIFERLLEGVSGREERYRLGGRIRRLTMYDECVFWIVWLF